MPVNKEKTLQPQKSVEVDLRTSPSSHVPPQVSVFMEKPPAALNKDSLSRSNSITKTTVPDVHNIKSFPAITESATKTSSTPITTVANPPQHSIITTCDKAVQSNFSYDDSFVREVPPSGLQKTTSMQNLQVEPVSALQSVKAHPANSIKRPNANSAMKDRRSKGVGRDNSISQPAVGHGDGYNELPVSLFLFCCLRVKNIFCGKSELCWVVKKQYNQLSKVTFYSQTCSLLNFF